MHDPRPGEAVSRAEGDAASAPTAYGVIAAGRRRGRRGRAIIAALALLAGLILLIGALVFGPSLAERAAALLPPAWRTAAPAPAPAADPEVVRLRERLDGLERALAAMPPAETPAGNPATGSATAELVQDMAAAMPGDPDVASRTAALEMEAAALRAADAGVASRLDRLEAEIGRLQSESIASERQMRDLTLIMVARRMVDLGRPLGRLHDTLRERFGSFDTPAVDALQGWSTAPQTRATLLRQLEAISDEARPPTGAGTGPAAAPADLPWWERIAASMRRLVIVRTPDSVGRPGADAAAAAARAALLDGDLALAIAQAERGGPRLAAWTRDARLLLEAERALERLETRILAEVTALEGLMAPPAMPAGAGAGTGA